jgi:hypothetical protein
MKEGSPGTRLHNSDRIAISISLDYSQKNQNAQICMALYEADEGIKDHQIP